ncbi:MAG: HD domain-containing phosphohydrolase [Verrucomicrobiia bacterium]|jgi:response regulator RpfG family c-di-GMP phosphodiesterase
MNVVNNNSEAKRPKILVVDDEEIVLVALRETIRLAGYEVVTAIDAAKGLEEIKNQEFAVILTDQQMPGMTGLEFLARVKTIQPDATRILITAVLDLRTVIDAINKGEIYRFIVKPWLREELLATIKNAVQRYELVVTNNKLQAEALAMNEKLRELNASLERQIKLVEEKNKALELNLERSIKLCLHTIETFYPILGSQAKRTNEVCKGMCATLSLPEEQKRALEIAALLHDIGLVGVPRQLIKKAQEDPLSLTEDERILIEHHPVLGEELVGFVHDLKDVGTIIRAHHERYDGSGYPDGLTGENIPWLARLLAVASAFAESRVDDQTTIENIKMQSGTAFDPDAVRALMRSLPRARVSRRQREVLLSELVPGMVLAKGIYTSNGMLLIPEGQVLNEAYIDKIKNHNRVMPINQTLLIYC